MPPTLNPYQWLLVALLLAAALWWLSQKVRGGGLFILAPILNDKRDALSLGRTALIFWLGVQGWFILTHPQFFMNLQWPPALVLIFSDLFLLTYCLGNKPHMRGLAQTVAGRMSIGGAASEVMATATAVVSGATPVPKPEVADIAEDAG